MYPFFGLTLYGTGLFSSLTLYICFYAINYIILVQVILNLMMYVHRALIINNFLKFLSLLFFYIHVQSLRKSMCI